MALRIRPARAYQRPNDPVRLLADAGRPLIRRRLRQAFAHLGDMVPAAYAERIIREHQPWSVKDAVQWGHFREVLKQPFAQIAEVQDEAAQMGQRKINRAFAAAGRRVRYKKEGGTVPPEVDAARGLGGHTVLAELFDIAKDIGDRFHFDRFDQETQASIRASQDALIKQLTTDARNSIDIIVMSGVRSGLSPADTVADVRALIGLTDTQARAVLNYRTMLENLDSGALARQLRDKGHDAQVRAAIASGQQLSQETIDGMVGSYTSNYLDYRASTIAGTESVRASNEGLRDSYRQAVERGALPDEAVRRFWQVDLTEGTCAVCLSIPDMNEEGISVDEQFASIEGNVEDPPIHPNCACSVEYVTDLDKVPDEPAAEPVAEEPPPVPERSWPEPGEQGLGTNAFSGFAFPRAMRADIEAARIEQAALQTDVAASRLWPWRHPETESQASFEARAIAQAKAEAAALKAIEAEAAALKQMATAAETQAAAAAAKAEALQARQFAASTYDAQLEAKIQAELAHAKAAKEAAAKMTTKAAATEAAPAAAAAVSPLEVLPKILKMSAESATGAASMRLPDGTIIRTTVVGKNRQRLWYINTKRSSMKEIRTVLADKERAGVFSGQPATAGGARRTYTVADFSGTAARETVHGEVHGTFTTKETASLRNYKNGGYGEINKALRAGKLREGSLLDTIRDMDAGIAKGKISNDGLIYRGVQALNAKDFEGLVGGVLEPAQFLSTSKSFSFADSWGGGDLLFRIRVEKGQTGLEYAKFAKSGDGEQEVILPRTARFLIHSVQGRFVNLVYLGD